MPFARKILSTMGIIDDNKNIKKDDNMGRPPKNPRTIEPITSDTTEEYEEVEEDEPETPKQVRPPQPPTPPKKPMAKMQKPAIEQKQAKPQAQPEDSPIKIPTPTELLYQNPNPPLTIGNTELLSNDEGKWFLIIYDWIGKPYNIQLQFDGMVGEKLRNDLNNANF